MYAIRCGVYFRRELHDFGLRLSSPNGHRHGMRIHRSPVICGKRKEFTLIKTFICSFRATFELTFRSTLTRYGSFNESSIRNGSNVYLNRLIRTIARTHNIANWNFLRALNWLCRLSCNFKRGKIDILSLVFDFRCKKREKYRT